jgi:opacity protein-like surface antigen
MKVAQFPIVILVFLHFLVVLPTPAKGEWFGDLYVGEASTEDGEITRFASGTTVTERQDFGSSFIIGLRVGNWLENIPWLGFAIDYSIFRANIDHEDVFISPVSFLAMVRMQLIKGTAFPRGRLQPYLGIGPGLFYSEMNSFSPAPWGPLEKAGDPDTSIDLGLDFRVGLAWSITHNLALFGEYRFSTVEPEFEENVYGVSENMETKLATHHWLAGISCRF